MLPQEKHKDKILDGFEPKAVYDDMMNEMLP